LTLITLANQKGGTGKSTLATNLAGLFAAAGRRVVLVDADPQHTAIDWIGARVVASVPVVDGTIVPGTPEALRRELAALRQQYDVVVVDTGGRVAPGVRQAVALADFVLVPTLPSLPDVRSTEAFYRQVLADVARERPLAGGIVLNGVQPATLLAREAEAYLRSTTLPVFQAVIRQYIAFREAIGRGLMVSEVEPHGHAARDMQALYEALEEEIR
jgi:chromosome partitioning protein